MQKNSELDYKNKRKFFEPFSGFRQKVLDKIDEIFVSKPERKKPSGALHEETFRKEEFYQSYGGKEGVLKALELGKIRKVNGKSLAMAICLEWIFLNIKRQINFMLCQFIPWILL